MTMTPECPLCGNYLMPCTATANGVHPETFEPALAKLIRLFHLHEVTYDYPDRPFGDLWSGSGVNPSISEDTEGYGRLDKVLEPLGAVEVDEWSDYPYRIVWRIDSLRTIVTHCEGDVSLDVARSEDNYKTIIDSAAKFYAEH